MELKTNSETTHALDPLPRQAVNNNGEALEELFSRHRRRLYNTARQVMGNSNEVEDALQDGLLCAFRNLSGFKGRSQFSTWLTRIVVNAALMRLRRRRLRVMISIDQKLDREDPPLANRIPDPGPDPEEVYARQERLRILEQKVRDLPTAYRQALSLCSVQGLSHRDAAQALGVPLGTLKCRLHRARLQLNQGSPRPV